MFEQDISFLGRLVDGNTRAEDARRDVQELSPIFRRLARLLLSAPPQERRPIWADFLAGRLRFDPNTEESLPSGVDAIAPQTTRSRFRQPLATAPDLRMVKTARRVRLTCAADLAPCAVDWLWSGRVPLGMITMFAGDPKLGKSYVTLAMAAALSRGLPLPMSDRPDHPGSTILMSAEDDPARTIAPRLVAGGADLTKIHILESVIHANGSEALPSLRADIDAITAAAARLGDCRLIVIDPVSAYLEGVDDNRNAALRGVLTPLNRLAEQLGAAVVLVSHLTKASSANGKHRVQGSIAYVGACRANHLFVADPADSTGRRVLILDSGSNIAPQAPTLAYVIEDRGSGPWIEWCHEPVTSAVGLALETAQLAQLQHAEQTARHRECDRWLRTFLIKGHRSTTDIFEAASNAGFSKNQVRRAKSRIGAVAIRVGFDTGAQWRWGLTVDLSSR